MLAGDWHPAMVDMLLTHGKKQLCAYCHYSNLYRLIKLSFSLFRPSGKMESDKTCDQSHPFHALHGCIFTRSQIFA